MRVYPFIYYAATKHNGIIDTYLGKKHQMM